VKKEDGTSGNTARKRGLTAVESPKGVLDRKCRGQKKTTVEMGDDQGRARVVNCGREGHYEEGLLRKNDELAGAKGRRSELEKKSGWTTEKTRALGTWGSEKKDGVWKNSGITTTNKKDRAYPFGKHS